MTERAWRWTLFGIHVPGHEPKKLGERAVGGLCRHAFIARDVCYGPAGSRAGSNSTGRSQTPAKRGWLLIADINNCPEFPFLRYSSRGVTGALAGMAARVTASHVTPLESKGNKA
jgi:hypothetical protein